MASNSRPRRGAATYHDLNIPFPTLVTKKGRKKAAARPNFKNSAANAAVLAKRSEDPSTKQAAGRSNSVPPGPQPATRASSTTLSSEPEAPPADPSPPPSIEPSPSADAEDGPMKSTATANKPVASPSKSGSDSDSRSDSSSKSSEDDAPAKSTVPAASPSKSGSKSESDSSSETSSDSESSSDSSEGVVVPIQATALPAKPASLSSKSEEEDDSSSDTSDADKDTGETAASTRPVADKDSTPAVPTKSSAAPAKPNGHGTRLITAPVKPVSSSSSDDPRRPLFSRKMREQADAKKRAPGKRVAGSRQPSQSSEGEQFDFAQADHWRSSDRDDDADYTVVRAAETRKIIEHNRQPGIRGTSREYAICDEENDDVDMREYLANAVPSPTRVHKPRKARPRPENTRSRADANEADDESDDGASPNAMDVDDAPAPSGGKHARVTKEVVAEAEKLRDDFYRAVGQLAKDRKVKEDALLRAIGMQTRMARDVSPWSAHQFCERMNRKDDCKLTPKEFQDRTRQRYYDKIYTLPEDEHKNPVAKRALFQEEINIFLSRRSPVHLLPIASKLHDVDVFGVACDFSAANDYHLPWGSSRTFDEARARYPTEFVTTFAEMAQLFKKVRRELTDEDKGLVRKRNPIAIDEVATRDKHRGFLSNLLRNLVARALIERDRMPLADAQRAFKVMKYRLWGTWARKYQIRIENWPNALKDEGAFPNAGWKLGALDSTEVGHIQRMNKALFREYRQYEGEGEGNDSDSDGSGAGTVEDDYLPRVVSWTPEERKRGDQNTIPIVTAKDNTILLTIGGDTRAAKSQKKEEDSAIKRSVKESARSSKAEAKAAKVAGKQRARETTTPIPNPSRSGPDISPPPAAPATGSKRRADEDLPRPQKRVHFPADSRLDDYAFEAAPAHNPDAPTRDDRKVNDDDISIIQRSLRGSTMARFVNGAGQVSQPFFVHGRRALADPESVCWVDDRIEYKLNGIWEGAGPGTAPYWTRDQRAHACVLFGDLAWQDDE